MFEDLDSSGILATDMDFCPEVVLLHGFTQTARTWEHVMPHLPSVAHYVVPDLPGHGNASGAGSLKAAAQRLAVSTGSGVFVGYSMGGRIALQIAVDEPRRVLGLVLIGATPGIKDAATRGARRAADEDLADEIERNGVDAFLASWLAQPMFAGISHLGFEERRDNSAAALADALRTLGTGTMEPLWEQVSSISCPVMLVVGEKDKKFLAIAEQMSAAIPDSHIVVIPGAGHAAHLESPEVFAASLSDFLQQIAPSS